MKNKKITQFNREIFINNILEFAKYEHLSLIQLSKKIGASHSYLEMFIRQKNQIPRLNIVLNLAQLFNISVEELLFNKFKYEKKMTKY